MSDPPSIDELFDDDRARRCRSRLGDGIATADDPAEIARRR